MDDVETKMEKQLPVDTTKGEVSSCFLSNFTLIKGKD